MSQPHYGRDMDRPAPSQGSVKRAREQAQAGYVPPRRPQEPMITDGSSSPQGNLSPPPRRHMPPSQPPPPLPNFVTPPSARRRAPPPGNGKGGHVISRPTQAPQWPLPADSPLTPGNGDSYHPPPGRPLNAPPRPARPSRIPSMVDQSRPQQPTPVFLNPQNHLDNQGETGQELHPSTPATVSSSVTSSSAGTIPEFPAPGEAPSALMPAPPRRSANLGPPPSSRRGASSFYSNASYVSPIPEESTRSHGSYASSAAMPETWSAASPTTSPHEAFYDDSVTDRSHESIIDDYGDESNLVRSASIGKKTRAALVDNKTGPAVASQSRPSPMPVQKPFEGGTGYMDESTSSSSNTIPTDKETTSAPKEKQYLTPLGMGTSTEVSGPADPRLSQQPSPSSRRLSAIRRPPNLDIDAVRAAEARGSITSLPDLIKRATRLAAMIERGKRPASRFDNFAELLEKSNAHDRDKDDSSNDKHQSGLSDMLAAFPPPAQLTPNARHSRGSWFRTTSWPLAPGRQEGVAHESNLREMVDNHDDEKPRKTRRCCGMPPWAFVLVLLLILCAITAAIVVPLEFFVFKNLGNHEEPKSSVERCQDELDCQNGGTNVFSQGVCSCICTNGFTGSDCSVEGSEGCTTTNLVSTDLSSSINDVTLGKAIPRLIADAQANFSIPLSGTEILAKINNGDISCRAQNSLVTFDGRPTRAGVANTEVSDMKDDLGDVAATAVATRDTSAKGTTLKPRSTDSLTSGASGNLAANFTVTEDALDFARVVVLYILQEETSNDAEAAQSSLQRFFSRAGETDPLYDKVTEEEAKNVTIGDNTINLVDLSVDIGEGAIGRSIAKRSMFAAWLGKSSDSGHVSRRGDSLFARK